MCIRDRDNTGDYAPPTEIIDEPDPVPPPTEEIVDPPDQRTDTEAQAAKKKGKK